MTQIAPQMHDLIADQIRRYDRPGPRYTSYPTAMEFHPGVGALDYESFLQRAAAEEDSPFSLYLHLPFCAERCHYCGCNVVITRKREVAEHYLQTLETEIQTLAHRLGRRRRLCQLHWGGGTPTYLNPQELRRLGAVIHDHFDLEPEAEAAIEIDPRVTTGEQLETLRALGFNRLSLGVQDFTPAVQQAVRRVQPFASTAALVETARTLGFGSINIDLIYGLPLQTPETFAETLDLVLQLRPERMAVYSYAHIPWIKPQQRRIREEDLPTPEVKLQLIASAIDLCREAGYRSIGMDHFALPDDELGRALEDGTLWRNFMGYTVRQGNDLIGCGMSAISDIAGGLFQNNAKLIRYQRAVDAGEWATSRGVVLSAEDLLRRHVITSLMCRFEVKREEIETCFGIDFAATFAEELRALEPLTEDGFVEVSEDGVRVVSEGRLFVRNVCMVFDAYRRESAVDRQFSRTV